MAKNKQRSSDPQLISYLTLRKAIGILGIAFPIALIIGSVTCCGCTETQSSISAYYHTGMRNLFVGLLCAIALFLFTYTGYDSTDSTAGNIGCFFALGVAFFPTSYSGPFTSCITELTKDGMISNLHFISAAGLFLTLAYISICRFTKTKEEPEKCWNRLFWKKHKDRPKGRKLIRNRIYIICGLIMVCCISLIAIYKMLEGSELWQFLSKFKLIFWLEALALWAFGISWLTKGRTIYIDIEKESVKN